MSGARRWTGRRSTWLVGLAAAAVLAYAGALYAIPASILSALRVPVEGTPAAHGVEQYERVEFPGADGSRLVAWWMPAPQATAAVVLVHGGGDNRNDRYLDILGIARRLLELRYAALAIDLRGHGESSDYPTGAVELGPSNASDVSAAVDWLLARDPDLAVGALGASMGGATVLYATARDPRIAGAVVVDPVLAPSAVFTPFLWASTGAPRWFAAQLTWSTRLFHGDRVRLDGYDPVATAAEIAPERLLLIQDVGDPITTVVFARALHERHPKMGYWETPPAPSDAPVLAESGRWGSHTRAFCLFPEEFMARVGPFLASRLSHARTDGVPAAAVGRAPDSR